MKLFRLRYILLGMLLYVDHIWCRDCDTEFKDAASKAFEADVVVIAELSQRFPPVFNTFNVSVKIKNKRNILKGDVYLKNSRSTRLLTGGEFTMNEDDATRCIFKIEERTQYLFFFRITRERHFFRITAMPISEKDKRSFKRGKKDVKKLMKCKETCVTPPAFDPKRGLKDTSVKGGRTLKLSCRTKKTFPLPEYYWAKDGVDVKSLRINRLSVKNGRKGSQLRIRKTKSSDAGVYECIARNIEGEARKQAVITVRGVPGQETTDDNNMRHKELAYGSKLRLSCKIKKAESEAVVFRWLKNDEPIVPDKSRGIVIRHKGDESIFMKERVFKFDEGRYTCIAESGGGKLIQHSNVTVTGEGSPLTPKVPPKVIPCVEEENKPYCLNNGTCQIMVEMETKFCTCPPNYQGKRCDTFVLDGLRKAKDERKLANDRTLVIVGIISGILLFIGICIASYFLAKRRRDQFRIRQRQRAHIEDIPQQYRPLIGSDDIDGLKRQMNGGVVIHKETQTVETCFKGSDNTNLYINPLDQYIRNENEANNPRSRKDAMSMDDNRMKKPDAPDDSSKGDGENLFKKCPPPKNRTKELASDGAPNERLNDLSPRRNPDSRDRSRPVNKASNVPNIPTSGRQPPEISIDYSDSEEEGTSEGTPLTPLHISEEEDNTEVKKPRSNRDRDRDMHRDREADRDRDRHRERDRERDRERERDNRDRNRDQHRDRDRNRDRDRESHRDRDAHRPGHNEKPIRNNPHNPHNPNEQPRAAARTKAKHVQNITPPSYNTAVHGEKEINTPREKKDKKYAKSSSSEFSDSSSTTEGCDSPTTALKSYSEDEDMDFKSNNWNERGSPEPKNPNMFQFVKTRPKPKVTSGNKSSNYDSGRKGQQPMRDDDRNFRMRNVNRDKKTIHL